MKRLWHIAWLVCSFLSSVLIIWLWDPLAGMGTGILVAMLLGGIAISHLLAGGVGCFLLNPTWRRIVLVTSIAMVPATLFSLQQIRDAWYLRHEAVYDRFRDNLVTPIPASVSDLHFIPLSEGHETHLMFQFTIAPEDLDRIIRSRQFVKIDRTQFRRPDDLFIHAEYLPVAEPATFYILNDIAAGYPDKGIGEGYTLKASADRRHVIFRRESASYYLYRYWESDVERASERQFLVSLGHTEANKTVQRTGASRSAQETNPTSSAAGSRR